MSLSSKIDFAVVFSVKNANPNGDLLDGNRPRQLLDGKGEVTDVCLKRKLQDRLLESGKRRICYLWCDNSSTCRKNKVF
ncbi:MAG: type I CRISPR-associated protein Cas7 [Deferribacteraceae bacterium]|jgi:CRISPR-associated protein Csd2|nr:type I CRISPR-associated protein Cas7 [Deferribacteraceae bacterium]